MAFIKNSYDRWNPEFYQNNSEFQFQTASTYMNQLSLFKFQNVLDIGCGDGRLTNFLASKKRFHQVLGVDLSEAMVNYAKKKYANMDYLNFQRGDAEYLNFLGQFDLVVSFWALHWVQDHQACLAGIHKSLRDGGEIFLLAPLNNALINRAVHQTISHKDWKSYFYDFPKQYYPFTQQLYESLLKEFNFKDIQLSVIRTFHYYPNQEKLDGFIRATLFHLKFIPELLQNDFMATVLKNYLLACSDYWSNYRYFMFFDLLLITAKKYK